MRRKRFFDPTNPSPWPFVIAGFVLVFTAVYTTLPLFILAVIGGVVLFAITLTAPSITDRLTALADQRAGETLADFFQQFDPDRVDSWVIRAAYERLQQVVWPDRALPFHADDDFTEQLYTDPDDLEVLVIIPVAKRLGRSLNAFEQNPYYQRIETVGDLVMFINAQPKNENHLHEEKQTH